LPLGGKEQISRDHIGPSLHILKDFTGVDQFMIMFTLEIDGTHLVSEGESYLPIVEFDFFGGSKLIVIYVVVFIFFDGIN
jgi:hypothetical protein